MTMHFTPDPPAFFPCAYLRARSGHGRAPGSAIRRGAGWLAASAGRLCESFGLWLIHRHMVRELQFLDDRMLADLGLSRGDIESVVSDATGHCIGRGKA